MFLDKEAGEVEVLEECAGVSEVHALARFPPRRTVLYGVVSAWFWSAAFGQSRAPWWVITVVERR